MTYCEDAPCCGCCGPSLYGSEVSSYDSYDQDYAYDAMMNDRYRAYEDECDHNSRTEVDGVMVCDWCEETMAEPDLGDYHPDLKEDAWLDGSYEE